MSHSQLCTPDVDWDVPSLLQSKTNGEAWAQFSPGKSFPRPNGFRYTGCEDSSDCHPGLTCQGQTGEEQCTPLLRRRGQGGPLTGSSATTGARTVVTAIPA